MKDFGPLSRFVWLGLAFGLFLCANTTNAQPAKPDPSVLTVERIFNSRDFDSERTPSVRWQRFGSHYISSEPANGGVQLVRHDIVNGSKTVVVPDHWFIPAGESRPLSLEGYEFSEDGSKLLIYTNSKRVWRTNSRGDYWILDLTNRELRKLGGEAAPSSMMFATLSPNGRRVAYVNNNNLFVQDLLDFNITPLTSTDRPTVINGTFDWVYEEELHLRHGFRWSHDSQFIAYWQLDTEGVKEFYITNSSDGPYPKLITIRYPKTGEINSLARIGVVSAGGGETTWLDIPGDPREHYLAKLEWVDQRVVAVQQFNRLQNVNKVMLGDRENGKVSTILVEQDRAWVENNNDFRWIDNGKAFLWLSERDGWRHLYRAGLDGSTLTPITRGNFDVMQIEAVDEKNGWIYFSASPENPTQRYLYRVALRGGTMERVTPASFAGTNSYNISTDCQWAVHSHSTFSQPSQSAIIHLPDHKIVKPLADNAKLKKTLEGLKLGGSEMFRVQIDDKTTLDGWCIKPPGFDPGKKYPVLFHVYGEPAGQTVLDRFGSRHHLWHAMMAQKGYVVLSVDNRGTPAPRGRDWRRCIYRQVGILASADQAHAVKALLRDRPYLDPTRIAIWGWSGGGSMTLNAIFRYPELYQTGISVAPVPNMRHYDTIYQERYMGLPSDNSEGYRNGSPIHFAHQLKGNLLLVHGTGDDNCHYLGMESLVDELVTHNKQFSMLSYPNRSHSIHEGRNTTLHLFESMTRFLLKNTPP